MQYPEDFETLWSAYPKRIPDNPKRMAYKAWLARIKEGTKAETLLVCTKEYARVMGQMGKIGTPFIMQTATFLGPNARFEDYEPKQAITIPANKVISRNEEPEERIDARPFLRELMQKLAGAKGLPS